MDYLNDQLENEAKVIQPNDGERIAFGNSSVVLRLTSKIPTIGLEFTRLRLTAGQKGLSCIIIDLWMKLLLWKRGL